MKLCRVLCCAALLGLTLSAAAQPPANLAVVARATGSASSGDLLTTPNDEDTVANEGDPWYSSLHRQANQWVEYEWPQPVTTRQIAVLWWDYEHTARLPGVYHLEYWT